MGLKANPTMEDHERPLKARRQIFLLVSLLFGLVCLGWVSVQHWIDLHQINRTIGASLLARSTADYSNDRPKAMVAMVNLGIVRDVIRDHALEPDDLGSRLATVTAVLLQPVPTSTHLPNYVTPTSGSTKPHTLIPSVSPVDKTVTATMVQTQILTETRVSRTPTQVQTTAMTPSPAASTPTQLPTKTRTATKIQPTQPLPTHTPTKGRTSPAFTFTPTPTLSHTPTPSPSSTPTELPSPTPTPTLTPTPTPSNTPTPTPTPTPSATLTPTETATPVDTDTPTMTPTPTDTPSGCSAPLDSGGNLPDGFVQAVDPPNGGSIPLSRNTITVYFNQNMNMSGNDTEKSDHYNIHPSSGGNLNILSILYNPSEMSVTLTFDMSHNWVLGDSYSVTVKQNLTNACNTVQGHDVTTSFTTGP